MTHAIYIASSQIRSPLEILQMLVLWLHNCVNYIFFQSSVVVIILNT